ncbi:MAG: aldo/keto reductase [Anaerolineae bacterium]
MSKLTIESTVTLNNGVEIPRFGLGTWQIRDGRPVRRAIEWALEAGYRLIDTAAMYGNERGVGQAVKQSGIPREEIFVTTKLWNNDHGYEPALRAFDESMRKLGLDYVDLYLIHWPVSGLRAETWRALEEIYEEGRARAIGVSNYTIRHLEDLLGGAGTAPAANHPSSSGRSPTVPAVNQVEFHPWLYQKDLLDYCVEHDILLEAYSPLTKGRRLDNPALRELAEAYGKSPAQILIRWALQHDIVVIPKSDDKEHIQENTDVFDFEISERDMCRLDDLDENYHCTWDPTSEP